MREQAFFHPGENHQRELQTLGRVQRHQGDLRVLVVLVGIADQRGVIEELIERLAAVARVHGGVYQFAQVLDAREGFRRVFFFELLDVSGAINQKLEKLSGIRRSAGSAEALDDFVASATVGGGGGISPVATSLCGMSSADIAGSEIKAEVAGIEVGVDLRLRALGRASPARLEPSATRQRSSSDVLRPSSSSPLRRRCPPTCARPSSISSRKLFNAAKARAGNNCRAIASPSAPHIDSPVSSANRSIISMVVLPMPRTGVLITRSSDTESSGFWITFKYEIRSLISARS